MKKIISEAKDTSQDENKFRKIIENFSDPIVVLDNNWCYTYLNDKAKFFLGKASDQDLLGKNIWTEFHGIIGDELKEACEKSMTEQQYKYLEQYFSKYNVWIEHHIYPSDDGGIIINFRNITKRKKREEEAHKLAQRNTLIIEKMRDNFLLTDEDLNIVDANNATCTALGYSREEILKMSVSDFYLKPKEEVKQNFKAVLDAGTLLVDTRIKKRNGEIADAEVTHSEMVIDGHKFIASFARDISNFKKAEAEIKKSNERFELIAGITQDAVWEVELKTGIRWGNEMHQLMYGLKKDEPAPDTKEWQKRIHPEDREQTIKDLDAAIKTRKNKWLCEYRFKTDNKGWLNIYDRTYIVYDKNNDPTKMLGSMLDITELKKAEEQILAEKSLSDSIINSLPGIFYLYNEKGQFLRWNNNFKTVSQYRADEIAGMGPLDFYADDEKELLRTKIKEVFDKGSGEVQAHFYTKNKEKIPYYFNGWITEIYGKKCLIGMGIDITELKKAEQSLHEMEQKILKQKVQEQKSISRAIINTQEKERNYIGRELHDNVNQILAGARLYLSMAGKQNETVKDLVKYPMELIDSSIKEIRMLTHKQSTPLRDVNLKQLAQNLVDGLNKNTSIKSNLHYEIADNIICEDLKINIYRILQEQISNIIKHAAAQNVCISISENEGTLKIMIKDDGRGFDPNKSREGIGISNIINRIDSYNGEFSIDSAPGKGCLVKIEIPLQQ